MKIRINAPYWAQQGRGRTLRYGTRSKFCSSEVTSRELASVLEIDQRCRVLGVSSLVDSNMNGKRKREIVHGIERER